MVLIKKIIVDLDDTICFSEGDYLNAIPNKNIIQKLNHYGDLGYQIVIHTSRNMKTYRNDVGKINIHTLPIIIQWLNDNNVKFDEVIVGKPWCGEEGFYVDDKSIRPSEFESLSISEINDLVGIENK